MSEVTRLLRLRQVSERTGLSPSTIYELVAARDMPAPVRISPRTSGWVEAEIESFLRERIAAARTRRVASGASK